MNRVKKGSRSNRSRSSSTIPSWLPMFILVSIAALDSADKALLAASFPVLQRMFGFDVDTLGLFSLVTNLSSAMALPVWGYLVHKYTIEHAHDLLSIACAIWGWATIGIASTIAQSSIRAQVLLRSLNGIALASIMPLSQMMLVQLVDVSYRGRAFGIMGLAERTANLLTTSSAVWLGDDWTKPYMIVGGLSILTSMLARDYLKINPKLNEQEEENKKEKLNLMQIIRKISRTKTFICLVAQGIFGGIPWNMMSFVLLLLDWKSFTKSEIVTLQVIGGIAGVIGTYLGGHLGDIFAIRYPNIGRILVAFCSVVFGTIFFGLFVFSNNFNTSCIWNALFNLTACWTPAAAIRPICADLARNPSERAQVVAFWMFLESTSAAILGAPLVGYITKHMFDEKMLYQKDDRAGALAFNLFALSTFFWFLCGFFWVYMGFALRRDKQEPEQEDEKHNYRRAEIKSSIMATGEVEGLLADSS